MTLWSMVKIDILLSCSIINLTLTLEGKTMSDFETELSKYSRTLLPPRAVELLSDKDFEEKLREMLLSLEWVLTADKMTYQAKQGSRYLKLTDHTLMLRCYDNNDNYNLVSVFNLSRDFLPQIVENLRLRQESSLQLKVFDKLSGFFS